MRGVLGDDVADRIRSTKVVAIVREKSAVSALDTARRLLGAGVQVIEVSMTTPSALNLVSGLRDAYPDAVVGAGTVVDGAAAAAAVTARAQFLVSPVLDLEVIESAGRHGLVVLPGCFTPTEMLAATKAGADFVKLFPASVWSPRDLRALLQALPHLQCVPTGGIDLADAAEWLAAGAVAVGLGRTLDEAGSGLDAELRKLAEQSAS